MGGGVAGLGMEGIPSRERHKPRPQSGRQQACSEDEAGLDRCWGPNGRVGRAAGSTGRGPGVGVPWVPACLLGRKPVQAGGFLSLVPAPAYWPPGAVEGLSSAGVS